MENVGQLWTCSLGLYAYEVEMNTVMNADARNSHFSNRSSKYYPSSWLQLIEIVFPTTVICIL